MPAILRDRLVRGNPILRACKAPLRLVCDVEKIREQVNSWHQHGWIYRTAWSRRELPLHFAGGFNKNLSVRFPQMLSVCIHG